MKKAKKMALVAAIGIGFGMSSSAYSYPTCKILLNMCSKGISWACDDYRAYCGPIDPHRPN